MKVSFCFYFFIRDKTAVTTPISLIFVTLYGCLYIITVRKQAEVCHGTTHFGLVSKFAPLCLFLPAQESW